MKKLGKIQGELSEEAKKLNDYLAESERLAPALSGAIISLIQYEASRYSKADWKRYEKKSGNSRLTFSVPKNVIEELVDDVCGIKEDKALSALKFSNWIAKEFLEGFREQK